MLVALLVATIFALLWSNQIEHGYTLGSTALLVTILVLVLKIRLASLLGGLCELALAHWIEVVIAICAAIILLVPILMLYVILTDRRGARNSLRH